MIAAKTKSKIKIEVTKSRVESAKIAIENTKFQEMLNRKTFFEQALVNLNNNPFKIVLL